MADSKPSGLTTGTPTSDDYFIFEDNADGLVKKVALGDLPVSGLLATVRNNTGSTLYKGTVVYVTGGIGGLPTVAKARANAESTSSGTFAVMYEDLANNTNGYAITAGKISTLDTRTSATNPFTSVTLADGDKIYLDPTTAGYVTNVKPVAPNHLVYLGTVTNAHPTQGTIEYRIINGFELDEIHDVLITSKADLDLLQYDSASGTWKNRSADTAGVVTKTGSQTLTNKTLTSPVISSISNTGTLTLPNSTDTLVGRATTDTLTNKRITKRELSEASSATPSINTDSYDIYRATALSANVTSITVSGTPTSGQMLLLSFTDNGTPRTLTPGSSFENSTIAFPATTVTSTRLDVLCIYNSATSKWRVIATA